MGVVTIAGVTHSLVWGQTMAEESLGLILLQRRSFFDDRISITRSAAFCATIFVDYTANHRSEINKSRPRLVLSRTQAAEAEINSSRGYYSNKYGNCK